jgi:ATP-dependent Clp protease ATP-binding subunit ClpA
MVNIVEKQLGELESLLKDKNVTIKATKSAKEYLADKGYSDTLGARVMNRVIQDEVKTPLTDEVLFGKLQNGGVVELDAKDGELKIKYKSEK